MARSRSLAGFLLNTHMFVSILICLDNTVAAGLLFAVVSS